MFVGVTLWPVTDRKQRFATAVAKASADPQFDESFCFILEEGRYVSFAFSFAPGEV